MCCNNEVFVTLGEVVDRLVVFVGLLDKDKLSGLHIETLRIKKLFFK